MITLSDSLIMEWLGTLPSSPAVKYAFTEYERGQAYYENRVRILGLHGKRVLDAGCGVGNWSIALGKTFERVDAIEYDWGRLDILNNLLSKYSLKTIYPILGSIEHLPYDDNSFDTVFCNGVFFVTRYKETIAEFKRVLKPGGFLYLTFDAKEWWNYLIFERGPQEPVCIKIGCEALLNRTFRLLDELKFEQFPLLYNESEKNFWGIDWRRYQDFIRLMKIRFFKRLTFWDINPIIRLLQKWLAGSGNISLHDVAKIHLNFLSFSNSLISAFDHEMTVNKKISELIPSFSVIYDYGTEEQKTRLARDMSSRLVFNKPDYEVQVQSHSFEPYEMAALLESFDFQEIGTAWEGHLIVDPQVGTQEPIYDANLGVYETLVQLNKNYVMDVWSSPDYFKENARNSPIRFSGIVKNTILSNHSIKYPYFFSPDKLLRNDPILYEGQSLKKLVECITKDSISSYDAFFNLYCFIQDALFHHPVFQLVDEFGSIISNSKIILLSGVGRCSHVAVVTSDLFSILGYKTRITQFYKHVCAEVQVDGRWIIVDPDTFKAGKYPINSLGEWLTVEEAKKHPHLLDAIPAIGLALDYCGPWSKNFFSDPVTGYVDAGLPWERPYCSYLYFGGVLRYPPSPPKLDLIKTSEKIHIRAKGLSDSAKKIRIHVDAQSRMWSYFDYPDKKFLQLSKGEIFSGEFTSSELKSGITIPALSEKLYFNTYALDDYMIENPSVYCWPSHEIKV